jgi:hypothetical protein
MPGSVSNVEEMARYDDPRLTWDMPGLFWDGPVPEAVRNERNVMADPNTKPMSPAMLQEDKDAVTAILAMTDYASVKPAFEKTAVYQKAADGAESGILARLETAEEAHLLAQQAEAEARDEKVALQWELHAWVLGAREQIAAKFGKNSDEYAATGLKKKSEYKRTGRKSGSTVKKAAG